MATQKQIPVLIGAIVTHHHAFADLPSADAQWVIENPTAAIRACIEGISGRNNVPAISRSYANNLIFSKESDRYMIPPNMRNKISHGGNKQALVEKLNRQPNYHGSARHVVEKSTFNVSEDFRLTDLVRLRLRDLGFTEDVRNQFMTADFCAKWSERNLHGQVIEPILPEDGPEFFLQQSIAIDRMIFAPVGDTGDIFRIEVDRNGQWLHSFVAGTGQLWDVNHKAEFLFRLREV